MECFSFRLSTLNELNEFQATPVKLSGRFTTETHVRMKVQVRMGGREKGNGEKIFPRVTTTQKE